MVDKDQVIVDLAREDPRYSAEAYHFIFEALDFTLRNRGGGRRHVSGEEIMKGVRKLALESFGYLARAVVESWGVTSTSDFGDIVFKLIDADLLQKTADDQREDFDDLFSFDEAFDDAFERELATVEL